MSAAEPLWTREDIDAVHGVLRDRSDDIMRGYATPETTARDRLFFTMGINSGLRPGDLIKLPADKELLAKDLVTIKMQKTKKPVTFNIGKSLRKALDEYWEAHTEETPKYLFYRSYRATPYYNRHVSSKWAYRFWQRFTKRAGVEGHYSSHSSRKTLANMVYMTTGDVVDAQMLLGHKDPGTTLGYIGVIGKRAREAQAGLNL